MDSNSSCNSYCSNSEGSENSSLMDDGYAAVPSISLARLKRKLPDFGSLTVTTDSITTYTDATKSKKQVRHEVSDLFVNFSRGPWLGIDFVRLVRGW
jgi:hypothetical protein